ncbi:MAG TPA: hypothetical protein VJC03_06615, partial [bacterium]|nr:hypothetical protein [bacterium]
KRVDKNNLEAVSRLIADMGNVFSRFKSAQSGFSQSDAGVVAEARKKFEGLLRNLEQKVQEAEAAKNRILKTREEEEIRRVEAEGRLREIKEKIDGWKGGDSETLEVTVGELKAGLIYLEGNVRRLAGGKKELKKVRENLKKIEKELSGMKAREAKESGEWGNSEALVKRLNEEVKGLMERVKGGGSVAEKEKLLGELEAEERKVKGEAELLVNSTGSERIEGNRKLMSELGGKVGVMRTELTAEVGKERQMGEEEKAAEGLLADIKRGIAEWKGKAEGAKGAEAAGMRGVLSGMAEARKRWEASLLGLKNESGSGKVEVLKGEAGNAIALLDAAGEGLSQALEARQAYETNLANERNKLTAEMLQYKTEVLQRSSALSDVSTADIAKWIQ